MNEENEDEEAIYPPPPFWKALLTLRNHTFIKLQDEFYELLGLDVEEGTFRHSVYVVDCYLDRVREKGWIEDGE